MGAELSLSQARRIALAAQGLAKERPTGPVTTRAVGRTFEQLQLVQIDSVNVLARSHFLPFYLTAGRLRPHHPAAAFREDSAENDGVLGPRGQLHPPRAL